MLPGAHELGRRRLRVALLVQLVDEFVPDVVTRQLVLLGRRRLGEAALGEFAAEGRIGRERERAGANPLFDHALEGERAGVAAQPELHRSSRARQLCRREPFQPIDPDVGAGG